MENLLPMLLGAIVVVIFLAFWIVQFAQLMALEDRCFPGRHDKVLWVVALVAANVAGAAAFWLWKKVMSAAREFERTAQVRKKETP